jgi:hypothetical protein
MKTTKELKRLTKKEQGFVRDYAKTGNGTLSIHKNYNVKNDNVAAMMASKKIRKDKIQNAIKSIAEQIPDSLVVEKHLELLNAQKIKRTYIKGDFQEETEEMDSQAVKAGIDMAYKIKGTYAPEKLEHSGKITLSMLANQALQRRKEDERLLIEGESETS